MSSCKVDKEEIATIIRCKEILKKIGHGRDLNIKRICEEIGISRKSAYGYDENQSKKAVDSKQIGLSIKDIQQENQLLKQRLSAVELENEGLRIAKMAVDDLKKRGLI